MTEFPETRPTLLAHVKSSENRDAWEAFVLIYQPVIYRMARRRGLQDADAQDLAQTVLARVADAIPRWEPAPDSRFRHWLRRVTKNAILNALSRAPRDAAQGGSTAGDVIAGMLAAPADIEQEIELESMREQYLRAAALVRTDVAPDTWRAFELSVIEGRSCEHVAETLGCSVGAVYAARSRVMRRLQNEIRNLESDE